VALKCRVDREHAQVARTLRVDGGREARRVLEDDEASSLHQLDDLSLVRAFAVDERALDRVRPVDECRNDGSIGGCGETDADG
jgi:hypothetical protein